MSLTRDLKCKNILRVCLVSAMAVGLVAGCAASNSTSSTNYSPIKQSINLYFESDSGHYPYDRYDSFYAIPCGDTVAYTDVQFVLFDPEANLEEELTENVGDYTLQNDDWAGYWFTGTRTQAIRKAKRVFAKKGCNLLVMQGVNGVPSVVRWPNSGAELLLIRWGSYGEPIN